MEHIVPLRILPKVDYYVISSVLFYLFMSTFSVCFLVGVIDAFGRMDEFINFAKQENYGVLATIYMICTYYICLTPQYFIQFMVPFVSMLSGIIVVTIMSGHREFTALRASGVPLQRVLLPIILTVFFIGLFVFIIRDYTLPTLVRGASSISQQMRKQGGKPVTIVMKDKKNNNIYTYMMGHFSSLKNEAFNFRLEIRKEKDWQQGHPDVYELYTDNDPKLKDSETGGKIWMMGIHPGHLRKGHYEEKTLPTRNVPTQITPAMLEQQSLGLAVMTANELAAFANDVEKQIELAQRRAAPFVGAIIMLMGISFILKRERENPGSRVGRIKNIIFSVVMCGVFYLFQAIFIGFAEADSIGPNTAAWLPILLFGSWGIYCFKHVNL